MLDMWSNVVKTYKTNDESTVIFRKVENLTLEASAGVMFVYLIQFVNASIQASSVKHYRFLNENRKKDSRYCFRLASMVIYWREYDTLINFWGLQKRRKKSSDTYGIINIW